MASSIFDEPYDVASSENDAFFRNIEESNGININGVFVKDRDGQNKYALSIMEALKDKRILLIEAGVGIGKSFGYLIPIFFTMNNVTSFKQVVISTSTMALQSQLLNDINSVSKMLDIDVNVICVKGIQNYVCLNKIENLVNKESDISKREKLKRIIKDMYSKGSADRSDLYNISNEVWEMIKASDRGVCSKCCYSKECFYQRLLTNIRKMDDDNEKFFLITNHAYLSYLLKDKPDLLKRVDSFVIDEAHKFEENVRNVNEGELSLKRINDCIGNIQRSLGDKTSKGIISKITILYSEIFRTINGMKKNNIRYDSDKIPFNFGKSVKDNLDIVVKGLSDYINYVHMRCSGNIKLMKSLYKYINELEGYLNLFIDMNKDGNSREYIYWAIYCDKDHRKISIHYSSKVLDKELKPLIDRNNRSLIFTSGTMGYDKNASESSLDRINREYEAAKMKLDVSKLTTRKGFYDYFETGLGLKGIDRDIEFPIKSPYNFNDNCLLYYNPNLISPVFSPTYGTDVVSKSNGYTNYIRGLVNEIDRLIRLTNGKSLILFTSKDDMKRVYKEINERYSYPFNLFIQGDNNSGNIKREFADDIDSVLFATGTFWEGIDVKGKSLSNLIICRLPFSNLDPILEGKASSYDSDERFKMVYYRDMMIKLSQGIGRLIRSENDTGIVCILDSRVYKYNGKILNDLSLPSTTDFDELERFVYDKKIVDEPKSKSR